MIVRCNANINLFAYATRTITTRFIPQIFNLREPCVIWRFSGTLYFFVLLSIITSFWAKRRIPYHVDVQLVLLLIVYLCLEILRKPSRIAHLRMTQRNIRWHTYIFYVILSLAILMTVEEFTIQLRHSKYYLSFWAPTRRDRLSKNPLGFSVILSDSPCIIPSFWESTREALLPKNPLFRRFATVIVQIIRLWEWRFFVSRSSIPISEWREGKYDDGVLYYLLNTVP